MGLGGVCGTGGRSAPPHFPLLTASLHPETLPVIVAWESLELTEGPHDGAGMLGLPVVLAPFSTVGVYDASFWLFVRHFW